MTTRMKVKKKDRHILAIDCCQHLQTVFEGIPAVRLTSVSSRNHLGKFENYSINLIVVGAPKFPIRRLFFNQLRHFFPEIPMLILRRERISEKANKDILRGEFLLSDRGEHVDLEIVGAVRNLLPLNSCRHLHHGSNYELVREITYILSKNYEDPSLNLQQVAREIPMSPARLSRILNGNVGISFRRLLRQVRIEEAKNLLSTRNYSIKEIAARVGFSDSHYFSRSFKDVTGMTATEYQYSVADLIFN